MTPQELKVSILQLAIQGKLVPQLPEEGTGEDLFRQIQTEKQSLIKAGKIKKEKLLPEIEEDEIPFDIPESWKWIKLGDVASVLGGKRIPAGRTLTTDNTGYKYIRVSDMKNGSVLTDNLLYVPTDIYPSISRYVIHKEDVYITVAGTIGRVGKIPPEIDGANLTENADRLVFQIIDQDWLIKCLESSLVQQQIIDATTKVGQPKLAIKRIQELLIPLPPLAEQKRIVAKIEELIPYIDRYEQAWSKLEEFNKRFPVDMQKSILQMAIQGKLVEQRPEEGTGEELYQQIQAEKQRLIKAGTIKKEKPLPEIAEDEIPFDIPECWHWVRLNDICEKIGDIDHSMPKTVITGIPFLSAKDIRDDMTLNFTDNVKKISLDDYNRLSKKMAPRPNDIIFSRIGTLGRVGIVQTDISFLASYSCCIIRSMKVDLRYLAYFLQSPIVQTHIRVAKTGIGVPDLSMKTIRMLTVPLPPLAEQKRIVAKLEEILPLCERLK